MIEKEIYFAYYDEAVDKIKLYTSQMEKFREDVTKYYLTAEKKKNKKTEIDCNKKVKFTSLMEEYALTKKIKKVRAYRKNSKKRHEMTSAEYEEEMNKLNEMTSNKSIGKDPVICSQESKEEEEEWIREEDEILRIDAEKKKCEENIINCINNKDEQIFFQSEFFDKNDLYYLIEQINLSSKEKVSINSCKKISHKNFDWKYFLMTNSIGSNMGLPIIRLEMDNLENTLCNPIICLILIYNFILLKSDKEDIQDIDIRIYKVLQKALEKVRNNDYSHIEINDEELSAYLDSVAGVQLIRYPLSFLSYDRHFPNTEEGMMRKKVEYASVDRKSINKEVEKIVKDYERYLSKEETITVFEDIMVNIKFAKYLEPYITGIHDCYNLFPFGAKEKYSRKILKKYGAIPGVKSEELDDLNILLKMLSVEKCYDSSTLLKNYYRFIGHLLIRYRRVENRIQRKIQFYILEKIFSLKLLEDEAKLIQEYDDKYNLGKDVFLVIEFVEEVINNTFGVYTRYKVAMYYISKYFEKYEEIEKTGSKKNKFEQHLETRRFISEEFREYQEKSNEEMESNIISEMIQAQKDDEEMINQKNIELLKMQPVCNLLHKKAYNELFFSSSDQLENWYENKIKEADENRGDIKIPEEKYRKNMLFLLEMKGKSFNNIRKIDM